MLLAALALLLVGFGAASTRAPAPALAQPVPPQRYVGAIAGTNAFIGVAVTGNHVEAYFCDGAQADVRLWGWFSGEQRGGLVKGGSVAAVGFIGLNINLNTQPVSIGTAVLQAQKVDLVTEGSVAT